MIALTLPITLLVTVSSPAAPSAAQHQLGPTLQLAQGWRGQPRQPPPPPPVRERVEHRRGQVWIPGNHEWRDGRYVWAGGHWEAERPGWRYVPGRWDYQGDHYVWIGGTWVQDRVGV